ncbi:alpha/beta hydrolase [Salinibacterium sp. SYSU T00001]|uniref:alpha/beta hydrolase n=1 Tax=Homoserinimonas sedimenticola TaxID=2986805 RepID=UPI002235A5B3|nr:alpha/beta hydrolase [Salinibacterium sedimenticola]MCW4386233.1 alpha/beta hydrolase [Salinibacterium sedimenticola]
MTSHRVLRDLVFAEHTGFRPLALDLHLPEREGRHPVVVHLHGGGWRVGSRRRFTPLVTVEESFGRIARAGFAVASVDYRLSGEAHFPAQVTDVAAALDWIVAEGAAHGLDAERIVLWGGSAGGTLAALAAFESRHPVRGVVDWYGPADLIAMARQKPALPGESREDQWLGRPVVDDLELAHEASPVHRVASAAPPFHIAHGAEDTDVPPEQSGLLAEALRCAGIPVELHFEHGAGHFWKGADAAPLFDRAIDFVRRVTF